MRACGMAGMSLFMVVSAQAVMVGHWTFDELMGLTAGDSTNANHATYQNRAGTGLAWMDSR